MGGQTECRDIKSNASGDIIITGKTNIGLFSQLQNGTTDAFIAVFGDEGNFVNAKQIGIFGKTISSEGIVVDPIGGYAITGTTTGSFDGQSIYTAGNSYMTTIINP